MLCSQAVPLRIQPHPDFSTQAGSECIAIGVAIPLPTAVCVIPYKRLDGKVFIPDKAKFINAWRPITGDKAA
jgi:hypothetical protein